MTEVMAKEFTLWLERLFNKHKEELNNDNL